jgi:hypothetical protein
MKIITAEAFITPANTFLHQLHQFGSSHGTPAAALGNATPIGSPPATSGSYPRQEIFTLSIWRTDSSISHLYGTQSHNNCMRNFSKHLPLEYLVRNVCLIATGLIFLFSVSELVLGTGGKVSIWRGLALSSLYLSICLMERRLFVPTSKVVIRSKRRTQHVN